MGDWWDHVRAASSPSDGNLQDGNIDINSPPLAIGGVSNLVPFKDAGILTPLRG
jgi:hypothetical protein